MKKLLLIALAAAFFTIKINATYYLCDAMIGSNANEFLRSGVPSRINEANRVVKRYCKIAPTPLPINPPAGQVIVALH